MQITTVIGTIYQLIEIPLHVDVHTSVSVGRLQTVRRCGSVYHHGRRVDGEAVEAAVVHGGRPSYPMRRVVDVFAKRKMLIFLDRHA